MRKQVIRRIITQYYCLPYRIVAMYPLSELFFVCATTFFTYFCFAQTDPSLFENAGQSHIESKSFYESLREDLLQKLQ